MAMQIRKINIGTRDTVHVVALTDLGATDARAMDVTSDGTLYVADAGRDVIIKVFESGRVNGAVVGTLNTAGNVNSDGIATDGQDARTNTPHSLCVDSSGNVYVGDGNGTGYQLRKMSSSGVISYFSGNYAFAGDVVNATTNGNDNTVARFSPTATGMGISVDSAGSVYIADTGNNKIKKIWSSGKATTIAGGGTAGYSNTPGNGAWFNDPRDLCVDHQGNCYIADTTNHRIRKVGESGVVSTVAGLGVASFLSGDGLTATFSSPSRICMDPSNNFFYVMDVGNAAIRKVMTSGQTSTFCSYNVPAGSTVGDICVDHSGFLYILEKN